MCARTSFNVNILDSTLRDGSQGEGISFSVQDKLHIVQALDELGVKYIEAGNPGSNPKDLEFFEEAKKLSLQNSTVERLYSISKFSWFPSQKHIV